MDDLYSTEEEIKAVAAIFPDLVKVVNSNSAISINLDENTDVLVLLKDRSNPKIEIFAPAFSSRFTKKCHNKLSEVCAEYSDQPNLYFLVSAAKEFFNKWLLQLEDGEDFSSDEETYKEDIQFPIQATPNELRARKVCSIEKLANELLVEIFEWLPPEDRLKAELVSNRWRKLAKDHSWSQYCSIFVEDFPCLAYEEDNLKLSFLKKVLLPRCARFIKEIDFRELCSSRDISQLTCMLPNLQHICLDPHHAYNVFEEISRRYSTLKSIVLERLQSQEHLLAILVSCPELEFIGLLNCRTPFQSIASILPISPLLKRLDIQNCDCSYALNLLTQVAENGIYLESLQVTDFAAEKINFDKVAKCGNRLIYLSLVLNSKESWICFKSQLHKLTNIRVLELEIRSLDYEKWPNELIKEIAKYCVNLLHLSIFAYKCADIKDIGVLAELNKLQFVRFYGLLKCRITHLFDRLVSGEKLKYFHTDATLPLKSVCKALTKCQGLTDISSGPYTSIKFAYKEIIKTLDAIHEQHKSPLPDDERICWIDFGNDKKEQTPSHVWAKFSEKRRSKVVEDALSGLLTCSRRYACNL